MGLFGRGKRERAADGAPGGEERPRFGHAAFDPADVEDARRGHPAITLQDVAPAFGFERVGSNVLLGAFQANLPKWAEYIFNVCRGVSPSGRSAAIQHELLELEAHNGSIREGGTFHDVRVTTHTSLRELWGLSQDAPPSEPFAGNAAWAPTTTAHVRAPETLRLPRLRIARANAIDALGGDGLGRLGLPGFRVRRGRDDEALLARIVDAVGPLISRRDDPHVDLRVQYGAVAVTVNGYRSDPDDLRDLLAVADGVAAALASLAGPASGEPFDALGPTAGSVTPPVGVPLPHPVLVPKYAEVARSWGLHHEDASHLMRLFPECAIPGVPSGVLVGTPPGTGRFGRVVWFEPGGHWSGTLRPGLILPARAGATTPVGGLLDRQHAMYVEVAAGLACCWRQQRTQGELDADALLGDGMAAFIAAGAVER